MVNFEYFQLKILLRNILFSIDDFELVFTKFCYGQTNSSSSKTHIALESQQSSASMLCLYFEQLPDKI